MPSQGCLRQYRGGLPAQSGSLIQLSPVATWAQPHGPAAPAGCAKQLHGLDQAIRLMEVSQQPNNIYGRAGWVQLNPKHVKCHGITTC